MRNRGMQPTTRRSLVPPLRQHHTPDRSLHPVSSEPVRPRPRPTVITHTRVIDGSGAPAYLGDVLLENGKITAILPPGGYADATGPPG